LKKGSYQGITSQAAEKLVFAAESQPQALKRGRILEDLAARLKSCPSQNLFEAEFFRSLCSDAVGGI